MRKSTKEEAEKKEIPPSPPIGRKGEEEKALSLAPAGACACAREDAWPDETPPDGFVNPRIIPTRGVALWHAHQNLGVRDPAFVLEWYEDMEGRFWCDGDGKPVRNWGMMLTVWVRNRARFAALRALPETPGRGRVNDPRPVGLILHGKGEPHVESDYVL